MAYNLHILSLSQGEQVRSSRLRLLLPILVQDNIPSPSKPELCALGLLAVRVRGIDRCNRYQVILGIFYSVQVLLHIQ